MSLNALSRSNPSLPALNSDAPAPTAAPVTQPPARPDVFEPSRFEKATPAPGGPDPHAFYNSSGGSIDPTPRNPRDPKPRVDGGVVIGPWRDSDDFGQGPLTKSAETEQIHPNPKYNISGGTIDPRADPVDP